MQRIVFFAVAFVLFASSAQAAGRMLMQQPTVTATIHMTRVASKQQQQVCSATVVLSDAEGTAIPDATVIFKWDSATASRTAVTNAAGRITTMVPVDASALSCSLTLQSVSVAGVPARVAIGSKAPRTISWV